MTLSKNKSVSLLRCLVAVSCFATTLISQNLDPAKAASSSSTLRATAVLGLQGVGDNSTGELSIQDNALVFSPGKRSAVQVPLSAIQGIYLSQEDKQIGGTPMALGRAAAPFEGGRVVGLFTHKKYDFVTLEYVDSNGGLHGTVYQLNKGQGDVLAQQLGAKGVHVGGPQIDTAKKHELETTNEK